MKNQILSIITIISLGLFISCKENNIERLETKLENKSEKLEDRADDIEDASDHIGSAAKNIEDAMENFRDALEEVDNPEDRKAIRKRINEIIDSIEIKKLH